MTEKFIAGVKPLQQFMDDGSFLMPEIPTIFRALQVLNAPEYIDYDYLLSISGMAVRLAWQQGWAGHDGLPNQAVFYNENDKGIIEIALERAGVKYTLKKLSDVGTETAEKDIKASVDIGVPVLVHGNDGCYVNSAILGYSGEKLYGVSTFADSENRIAPHGYNEIKDWKSSVSEYILIDEYTPKNIDSDLLIATLKTAVYLARTTHKDTLGDAALGIASFDAVAEMMVWDESFEPLNPGKEYNGKLAFPYDRPDGYYRTDGAGSLDKRFWDCYCDYLCMLNGYSNFSRFLEKYADLLPEHSEQIKKAAAHYFRACDYSGELWKYVTPDSEGVAKFKGTDVRYAFAAHMLRAKIYTIKAVEILESIIA